MTEKARNYVTRWKKKRISWSLNGRGNGKVIGRLVDTHGNYCTWTVIWSWTAAHQDWRLAVGSKVCGSNLVASWRDRLSVLMPGWSVTRKEEKDKFGLHAWGIQNEGTSINGGGGTAAKNINFCWCLTINQSTIFHLKAAPVDREKGH